MCLFELKDAFSLKKVPISPPLSLPIHYMLSFFADDEWTHSEKFAKGSGVNYTVLGKVREGRRKGTPPFLFSRKKEEEEGEKR